MNDAAYLKAELLLYLGVLGEIVFFGIFTSVEVVEELETR
jgi:hypothetical protein